MQQRTDRTIFKQGVKYLIIALPLLVIAPVLITVARLNRDNNLVFWLIFIPGLIVFFAAMYTIFKGVNTLLKSFFGKKSPHKQSRQ